MIPIDYQMASLSMDKDIADKISKMPTKYPVVLKEFDQEAIKLSSVYDVSIFFLFSLIYSLIFLLLGPT